MKIRIIVCFLLVVLLISCAGNRAHMPIPNDPITDLTTYPETAAIPSFSTAIVTPQMSTATPTRQMTVQMTPQGLPSKALPSTEVVSFTVTPVIPAEARLQFRCLDIEQSLLSEVNITGVVVLQSFNKGNRPFGLGSFLFNLDTGMTVQIAKFDENQNSHSVSPDRKHLAYESIIFDSNGKVIRKELVIMTADGQVVKTTPWEKGWVYLTDWLDDERVVINISGLDSKENQAEKASTLLALNPFTGKRQTLRPNFPNVYPYYPVPFWEGWSIRVYDPALTRAAYYQAPDKEKYGLALWDMQKQQVLGRLFPYSGDKPCWSPNGSRLVVEAPIPISDKAGYELFLMSRNGEIEQLTNLHTYADVHLLSVYSWSPDGRYIAAWVDSISHPKEVAELVIIDTNTRQVENYCIPIKYRGKGYTTILEPLWSPDGRQLILNDQYEKDRNRVILVDRLQGIAAQIAADMQPVGWMVALDTTAK